MGFHGYPEITIAYFGESSDLATQVVIAFVAEEGSKPQVQKFSDETDVRESEVIQSALVKIIERSGAQTVKEIDGVAIIKPD